MASRRTDQGQAADLSRRQERSLVIAAGAGSEDAIERLFRAHWPRAYRAAYLVTHDRAAAEDIAQEAFLAAIRKLESFDSRRPFGPWIHRIAVNRAIDWARSRALRAETGPEPLAVLASASGQEAEDPRSARLAAAVAALSPEHRAIVAMRYVLDLTPGEIAAELELPRGTVNSRLRRALDHLATELPG